MHDTSELFQREKEVVQRVYHRDIHDWQPLPVSLDAFLVWEHFDPMIPFGSQLRTWHWYIYPETYLPISCAFFIFLAVWKVLQTWSKEMPLHFLVIKLSFRFHLQTCCLFPISYHISESKSSFLLKAAIVSRKEHFSMHLSTPFFLVFHFQPCAWATPSIFPLLKLIAITESLSSGRYEALLRLNFTQLQRFALHVATIIEEKLSLSYLYYWDQSRDLLYLRCKTSLLCSSCCCWYLEPYQLHCF